MLNQSYRQIELIVIDDGSTDDSVNCLRQIKDPRFSFCCQENRGAHEAINLGLNLASGEFLAILNSDDEFHPNRIERLLTEFRNDPEVELLSTWIEVIDANGQQLAIKEGWHTCEPWPIEHPKLTFQKTEDFGLNLLMGNFVASTSNIFMRRSLYDQVGGSYQIAVYDFSKGKRNPYARQLKQSVTMRIDRNTLDYFKTLAGELDVPYQTLINLYLRDCATTGRRPAMTWRPSRSGAA